MATSAREVYAYVMVGLVAVGFVINIASIALLSARKQKSMFHTLLKVGKLSCG